MIRATDTIVLDDREVSECFVRATGPGAQSVNKGYRRLDRPVRIGHGVMTPEVAASWPVDRFGSPAPDQPESLRTPAVESAPHMNEANQTLKSDAGANVPGGGERPISCAGECAAGGSSGVG